MTFSRNIRNDSTPQSRQIADQAALIASQYADIARLTEQSAELLIALELIAERIAGGFPGYEKASALYELGCKAQNAIAHAWGEA